MYLKHHILSNIICQLAKLLFSFSQDPIRTSILICFCLKKAAESKLMGECYKKTPFSHLTREIRRPKRNVFEVSIIPLYYVLYIQLDSGQWLMCPELKTLVQVELNIIFVLLYHDTKSYQLYTQMILIRTTKFTVPCNASVSHNHSTAWHVMEREHVTF